MPDNTSVLIVTNKADLHVDVVLKKLSNAGFQVFRWNIEDFPDAQNISLQYGRQGRTICSGVSDQRRGVLFDTVRVAWYRRPGSPQICKQISDTVDREVAQRECDFLLRGLWQTWTSEWINPPHLVHAAGYKVAQLGVAGSHNLRVPATLITNDIERIRNFGRNFRKCIVKPISGGFLKRDVEQRHIYCNPIDISQLTEVDLKACPVLIQEAVPKKIELRVTIMGDQVFTCSIDSQASSRTQNDWRRYDMPNVRHTSCDLPNEIAKRLKKLLEVYGLEFGAFDLILTPDDEYVFLELNPNGQWYWIEELTGLPISDGIVRHITQKLTRDAGGFYAATHLQL